MVRNFRKDGTEIEDMKDVVLTQEEYPEIFAVLDRFNEKIIRQGNYNKREVEDTGN